MHIQVISCYVSVVSADGNKYGSSMKIELTTNDLEIQFAYHLHDGEAPKIASGCKQ